VTWHLAHQNQWLERQKTNRLKRGAWWFQGSTTTTHQLEYIFFTVLLTLHLLQFVHHLILKIQE
jgi:hypothetical protein